MSAINLYMRTRCSLLSCGNLASKSTGGSSSFNCFSPESVVKASHALVNLSVDIESDVKFVKRAKLSAS